MPSHKPTITIGGLQIPCDFTPQGTPVVLDGVSIVWGRDGVYEPTEPSQLTARILDPDGQWGSNPALYGSTVILSTDLGVLFRGRVDTVELEPVTLGDDPATLMREIWQVTITAVDVIADLSKIVAPGPGWTGDTNGAVQAYYGPGFWFENHTEGRRAQVQAAIAALGIPTKVETRNLATALPPGAGSTWQFYYREPSLRAGDDLYALVRSVQARGDEVFHSNYLPASDRLVAGRWPAAIELILTYLAGVISVTTSAGNAYTVPCGQVGMRDAPSVRGTVVGNVAAVEVTEFMSGTYYQPIPANPTTTAQVTTWDDSSVVAPVSTPGGGTGRYQSPAKLGRNRLTGSAVSETGVAFAQRLAPLIAQLNGKLTPPLLTFDLEENAYPADVQSALLATWSPDKAWIFPGARYEGLLGWGPAFQLIGGELVYEQGWTVEALFAPSRATDTGGLAINQLVTTDPPTFNQYDSSVSLATLGTVQKGI